MNINSTLLIQMVNVVVAYFLFEFILVRPVAHIMQQEDATDRQLLNTINQAQEAITTQEIEFQRQKKEWQLRLLTARPSLEEPVTTLFGPSAQKEPFIEKAMLDKLIAPITDHLVKKVEDECISDH